MKRNTSAGEPSKAVMKDPWNRAPSVHLTGALTPVSGYFATLPVRFQKYDGELENE